VRSNGLVFVLLSNVGLLGTVMFLMMLWRAYRGPADTPIMLGLTVALVSITASRMISQTTIAPGIMFAMLIGARTSLDPMSVKLAGARQSRRILFRHG